ncbi:hypothetical protein, partial [Lysinibacillus sp. fls2-241-R2A-57]|uniref:hypothetical protein n=1 Tax=Lysinibacillus sp. fls2-241-R2A-57 TaxID=3040292 RepID=UPI002553A7D0
MAALSIASTFIHCSGRSRFNPSPRRQSIISEVQSVVLKSIRHFGDIIRRPGRTIRRSAVSIRR